MRRWACTTVRRTAFPQNQPVTRTRDCQQYGVTVQAIEHPRPRPDPLYIQPKPIPNPQHDPYSFVAPELSRIRGNILGLLDSTRPGLGEIAQYYFLHPSKQLRSLLVLLFSCATNGLGRNWETKQWEAKSEAVNDRSEELDRPLKVSDVLNNPNPTMPNNAASFKSVFELQLPGQRPPPPSSPPPQKHAMPYLISPLTLLPAQLRLAQIVEMIHIASLLHDDVHDPSSSDPPSGFGNKLSILGGDFLLGRASTALARLGESEVVELIAGVISNVVEGEMLRMQGGGGGAQSPISRDQTIEEAWHIYLRRTYLKTASLMAKSARAAVILGGCMGKDVWKDVAYAYGRNLGIAYQLAQDTLDYEATGENPRSRLFTGPVLFAREEHPELQSLIQRNFSADGDAELAIHYVTKSSGVERTRLLAQSYSDKAREVLQLLPDSETKTALDLLIDYTVNQTW